MDGILFMIDGKMEHEMDMWSGVAPTVGPEGKAVNLHSNPHLWASASGPAGGQKALLSLKDRVSLERSSFGLKVAR